MGMLLMFLLMVLLGLANIFVGAVSIPIKEIAAVFRGDSCDPAIRIIILEGRLPQMATAMFAGAGLAVCGLMLQTLFRNPLAGPSILGITSGSSLGVAVVMLLFGSSLAVNGGALTGGLAAMAGAVAGSAAVLALLLLLSTRMRNNLTLLISGMMIGYMASSLVTLLSSLTDAHRLQGYVMWGMGSFSELSSQMLPGFIILTSCGLGASMLLAKPLNLLLLGDNYALNLGVDIRRTKTLLLAVTGLLSAIITAACGPIGFVGLAMPHIARMIFRTDNHFVLIPATMICGAILALACNLISVMPAGHIIPINALTPIAGIPVVLYVILRKK